MADKKRKTGQQNRVHQEFTVLIEDLQLLKAQGLLSRLEMQQG
jgi:hypothetical protein